MTNIPLCSYRGNRDEAIVEYLYGDADGVSRPEFEAHLERCAVCRAEIDGLGGVRRALADWAPPEPVRALDSALRANAAAAPARPARDWRDVPAWARVAAAVLCLGIGLGAANLRVRYGTDGLSVTTGWLTGAPAAATAPAAPAAAAAVPREVLAAVEQQLRTEVERAVAAATVSAKAAPGGSGDAGDALVRQVRTLIAQSERRQQNELALRIGDVLNDVQSQRRADLSKIDRSIGLVQNTTGMEVLRQREMLNSLAVRVSAQRQ